MSKSTKSQILFSFSELLKKNELDKITVTMLVSECGISRQTFYYHFSDIQALINWGIQQTTAGCLENVKSAKDVNEATIIFLNCIENRRFFLTRCMESSLSGYVITLLKRSITEYISFFEYEILQTAKSSAEDAKFIITFLADAVTGLVVSSIGEKKAIDIQNVAEKMERTILSKFISQ